MIVQKKPNIFHICTYKSLVIDAKILEIIFISDYHARRLLVHMLLFDFINLTQVHNFTVSAHDIFTFRRLSVFTASFTGILQVQMQIMNRFVPSYWLVKWLCYRVYNEKVVSSSPPVFFFYLYSIRLISFIIDVPRPLRNEILDHFISKG